MVIHSNHGSQNELQYVLDAVKNDKLAKVTNDEYNALGLSDETQIISNTHTNLPISNELHRIDRDVWISIETHTSQQGSEYTEHYINGIGELNLTPVSLNTNQLREKLGDLGEESDTITALTNAIKKANQYSKYWAIDELVNNTTWGVIADSHIFMHCHVAGYHLKEIFESENTLKEIGIERPVDISPLRKAIDHSHGIRGSGMPSYDFPHTIHFKMKYELDPSDVTLDDITE
jgi:hypothetical protein